MPEHILLGTHAGLYESTDGGRDWRQVALVGQDAMNLARSEGETVWTAGHNVLARSSDGGATWSDVRPQGLPSLDIHGFAVDPRDQALWAAVAGQGLYRSTDGGATFALVSKQVGGSVMALAVTPEGRVLAGDMQQGLLASENEGEDWRVAASAAVMGLAINPEDPTIVLAAGPGILRSSDGGSTWQPVLQLGEGAGPVAWSSSDADVGYAVGFDRTLTARGTAGDRGNRSARWATTLPLSGPPGACDCVSCCRRARSPSSPSCSPCSSSARSRVKQARTSSPTSRPGRSRSPRSSTSPSSGRGRRRGRRHCGPPWPTSASPRGSCAATRSS
jgi:Photosynthesis system II assembly factor YCF48